MAAWICQWAPQDGDPPSPCSGDLYVVLYGPSNEDGRGSCARHLGEMTAFEMQDRPFVVVAHAAQIPAPTVVAPYRRAS